MTCGWYTIGQVQATCNADVVCMSSICQASPSHMSSICQVHDMWPGLFMQSLIVLPHYFIAQSPLAMLTTLNWTTFFLYNTDFLAVLNYLLFFTLHTIETNGIIKIISLI